MDADHWQVSPAYDLADFFLALAEFAPADSTITLVCGSWSENLRSFLENVAVDHVKKGWIFTHERYTIPISDQIMRELSCLASSHAAPEIASSIVVKHDAQKLVEWFDLPDDPISIAPDVDENKVIQLATSIGATHKSIMI